jgi:hypothetical protein
MAAHCYSNQPTLYFSPPFAERRDGRQSVSTEGHEQRSKQGEDGEGKQSRIHSRAVVLLGANWILPSSAMQPFSLFSPVSVALLLVLAFWVGRDDTTSLYFSGSEPRDGLCSLHGSRRPASRRLPT